VDRAALDVALESGIPCGGWCPKGRLAEDGVIDARYPLRETPTAEYAQRTAWNVRDSDGTLVLTWGPPTNGTALTVLVAEEQGKPHFVVDLAETDDLEPAREWVEAESIRVLNVAGPRASKCPEICQLTKDFLTRLLSCSSS
jgi:hypothetical protein